MMRLRIGFLVYDFGSYHSGGIATYIHNLANSLTSDGHHVEVFTGRFQADLQLPYKVNALSESQETLGRLELSQRFADALHSRNGDFDLVEATDWGMEGYYCLRRDIFPCIIRFHTPNSVVEKLNGCSFRRDSSEVNSNEIEYFGRATHLTAPSQAMISLIYRLFPIDQSIVHLPNPVNAQYDTSSRIESRNGSPSNIIGFLGRLERRKGVYELAQALVDLFRDYPHLRFHFAGPDTRNNTGSVGKDLQAILRPIQEQVRFLGYLSRKDREQFLASLKLCVLPSLWENAPYSCLEAMAFGVNLVVTSGSGFEEIVGEDSRVVFAKPGDSSSLSDAIRVQIHSPDSQCCYHSIQRFHWDKLREPTIRFYEQVAGRTVPRR